MRMERCSRCDALTETREIEKHNGRCYKCDYVYDLQATVDKQRRLLKECARVLIIPATNADEATRELQRLRERLSVY